MLNSYDKAYEAESGVIGSILLDASYLPDVSAIIKPEDFSGPINKLIYETALDMSLKGEAVDAVTVYEKLKAEINQSYIVDLLTVTPTAANAKAYAQIVKRNAKTRRIVNMAEQIILDSQSGADPDAMAAGAYTSLGNLDNGSKRLYSSTEAAREFMDYRMGLEKSGGSSVVKSGIAGLDNLLGGGLTEAELHILAGRPGNGKTTLAVYLTDSIAARGTNGVYFSLEMSLKQITAKRYSLQTGIPLGKLLNGKLSNTEQQLVGAACRSLSRLPVTVLAERNLTVNDIMLACRRIKGLQFIVIDYLTYIKPSRERKSRYEEFSEVSNDLKNMASTLNLPVLCLAQLNRENEKRGNKRPMLSDLRETGMIEQDAASVTFIHRENKYEQKDPEEIELIVAKSRYSPEGIVPVMFYGSKGQYVEVSRRTE